MAGLTDARSFVAGFQQSSEFDQLQIRRVKGANDLAASATETPFQLFEEAVANPACQGIAIERFYVRFTVGETWSGANNMSFQLTHNKGTDTVLYKFDGGVDASNISVANSPLYIELTEYAQSGLSSDGSIRFVADTQRIDFSIIEEGTATTSDVCLYIVYREIPGANPIHGDATLAA